LTAPYALFQEAKDIVELTSYIATIVIAVAAVYALEQIRVMKLDMRIRNERAAKEKAIEYASRYLTRYIELYMPFFEQREKAKLPSYEGEIGDFTLSSLDKSQLATALKRYKLESWLPSMNELQAIASAFMTGVADEGTGFDVIGRTFCSTVVSNYDIICICRQDTVEPHFQSIVALYQLWSQRLSKAELTAMRTRIEKRIGAIPDLHIPHIGK
jgi:hypothetical protein